MVQHIQINTDVLNITTRNVVISAKHTNNTRSESYHLASSRILVSWYPQVWYWKNMVGELWDTIKMQPPEVVPAALADSKRLWDQRDTYNTQKFCLFNHLCYHIKGTHEMVSAASPYRKHPKAREILVTYMVVKLEPQQMTNHMRSYRRFCHTNTDLER